MWARLWLDVINPGDESYSNPSLSGCCSNNPPSGDDIPATSLDLDWGWTVDSDNLVNLISFTGIKEILTLTKGKESIKGKETVDALQSVG